MSARGIFIAAFTYLVITLIASWHLFASGAHSAAVAIARAFLGTLIFAAIFWLLLFVFRKRAH